MLACDEARGLVEHGTDAPSHLRSLPPPRLDRLHAAVGRAGPDDPQGATAAAMRALLHDLDVVSALDLAEEAGGAAARTVLRVLSLDAPEA